MSHDVHFIQKIAQRVVRIEHGEVRDYPGDWGPLSLATQAGKPDPGKPSGICKEDGERAQGHNGASCRAQRARARKEEKRLAAETRNQNAAKTKVVRAEIARLDKDMARLEGERKELEARLADPSTYEAGSDNVRESQQRHAEISRELEECRRTLAGSPDRIGILAGRIGDQPPRHALPSA